MESAPAAAVSPIAAFSVPVTHSVPSGHQFSAQFRFCFAAIPEPTVKPLDQLHFHHQLEKTCGSQHSTNSSRLIHTFPHSAACTISTAQDYHPDVSSNSRSGVGAASTPALCPNRSCPASAIRFAVWSNSSSGMASNTAYGAASRCANSISSGGERAGAIAGALVGHLKNASRDIRKSSRDFPATESRIQILSLKGRNILPRYSFTM